MNALVVPTTFLAKDKMTSTIAKMSAASKRFAAESAANFRNAGQGAFDMGRRMAVTGALIAAPLVVAGKQAVEFEDKLSDIGKTTGLSGNQLKGFGDEILNMSLKTRSSIQDLATIAEIGGRLGIAQKDLKAFTVSANEFAVALGGDFSGGVEQAITQFGKVTSLFRDTKNLDVAPALQKAGSAFNALSAKGVNVEGLTDFSLRVGALPEAMRPSLSASAALGATLQKSGVDAQIAASGFSNFVSIAARQLPMFAQQMGISVQEARNLMNTDTATFFAKFSASMRGVPADQLAIKLKSMGLNSLEVQKAIGGMSGSLDTYNELLGISNEQMTKGTSITQEYNTKNNNTAGQMAKLKNNMQTLAITVGNALLPVLNSLAESVMPMIQRAGQWMQRNKGLVTTIVKIVAAVSAFSFAISGLSFVVGSVQKAFAVAKIAMAAFNLVMSMNPIGLVIAGAVALTAVVYGLSKAFNNVSASEAVYTEVKKRALEKTVDQRVEMMILFNTLRKAKEGSDEYRGALQKIDQMSPGLVAKYQLQEKSLRNIANAEKDLANQIMNRAMVEARAEILKEKMKEQLVAQQEGPGTMDLIKSQLLGGGANPLGSFTNDMIKRQQEIGVLSKQVAQDQMNAANPEQAKQESTLKNTLNVNFSGLPAGTQATVNGKNMTPTGGGGLQKKFAGTN